MNKFLLGFEECVREVETYLKKEDCDKKDTLQRLLQHLVQRSEDLKNTEDNVCDSISPLLPFSTDVQDHNSSPYSNRLEPCCHIRKNSDTVTSIGRCERLSNSREYCTLGVTELRLVPKRLANGEFALVLPQRVASSVNYGDVNSRTATTFRFARPGSSDPSTFHQDTSSTVSSRNEADSPTFGNNPKCFNSESPSPLSSETSDFSSDESLVKPRERQELSLPHPADNYFEDIPRNQSSFSDNVWRPW
ncbi:uncharacterized protein LOC106475195 [Limulus polyphemus]|uniref:Uncharacterized protein LOC106475195 n=1 Tax=Limulus polyphemus TaxID=6850 RepID=A0ABM1BZ04_LIMPO|nr:uncharacterized protein LOC106475195 [Limulus polyphemus]